MTHDEWCLCDACKAKIRQEIERDIQNLEHMDDPRAAPAAKILREAWRKLREQAKEPDSI